MQSMSLWGTGGGYQIDGAYFCMGADALSGGTGIAYYQCGRQLRGRRHRRNEILAYLVTVLRRACMREELQNNYKIKREHQT